jgi:xylan 1,4-beta-xylosidase
VLAPESPLLSGTYPDPSVVRVGDDFYLVTSTFEYFPALPIFHSTDLEHWTQLGHAVDRLDQVDLGDVASSGGLYAPTIRWHDGTFYVVCTVVGGSGPTGHFLLTATDAAGPWSDPIWIEGEGFDPSLTFDEGRAWLVATRLAPEPQWHDQAEVWMRELDLATHTLVGPEHVLWHGAVENAVWAEGPHLYRVGDWYYLLASEGGTEEHHAISVARSRAITGPYVGNRANPVFSHRALGIGHPITGVGHPDLVEGRDGLWWAVMLGSRPVGGYHALLGRETFACPVDWEHGWPVFARGVGQLAVVEGMRRLASTVEAPDPWTQVRTRRLAGRVDGDAVTLHPGPGLEAVDTPAFLGVRQRDHRFEFAATVPAGMGIALRQSETAHLLFSASGVVRVAAGRAEQIAEVGNATRLRVVGDGNDYTLYADDRLVTTVDGRFLSTQTAYALGGPSFVGVWVGLFSTAESDATATAVTYR